MALGVVTGVVLLGCSGPHASAPRATTAIAADVHAAPDPTGGGPVGPPDVADAAVGGASFEVASVLVPGRVTVIDFWASWCRPCARIDRMLRELASRYPDDLAVRRAEVPGPDHPIAVEHLGGVTSIPQIFIYGRDGALVDRLYGPGDAYLRRRLEEMLGPSR
ncbi:thioredoxin family protein [bacterium AH-315-N03]|nr:thioredoxin family protein [bacterium AH-315-N03]